MRTLITLAAVFVAECIIIGVSLELFLLMGVLVSKLGNHP